MGKLTGKTALITGAASGMGKAMAIQFAGEGAAVMVSDVNEADLQVLVLQLKTSGAQVTGKACNMAHENDVKQLIESTVSHYGTLDILVNNAGIMDDFMPTEEVSTELWNMVMGVNINGPFFACRAALPQMLKQQGGSIINIASVGGLFGSRAGVAYTASKHALIGLTKNIGFMYAQKGIRCNAIAPGAVNTNIGKNMQPNAFGYEKAVSGSSNLPRVGSPEEIATVALFLASHESSFVNGAVLTADGGWTAY